jgi:hypothetical protein
MKNFLKAKFNRVLPKGINSCLSGHFPISKDIFPTPLINGHLFKNSKSMNIKTKSIQSGFRHTFC